MPSFTEIVIQLTARADRFDAELRKSQAALKALEASTSATQAQLQKIGATATQAGSGLNTLGANASRSQAPLGRVGSVAGTTGAAAQKMGQNVSATGATLRAFDGSAATLGGTLGGITSRLSTFALGFATVGTAIAGVRAIASAGMGMDRLERSFQAITGSAEGSKRELDFVRASANRLGLDFETLAQGYRGLSAASMGTALQGDKTKQVFLDVVEAGRALGLSNEQLQGSLRAIGQMASTGVVQMDELRNELGQHMPIAMTSAARATSLTGEEFRKLVETGTLATDDWLPKLGKQLRTDAVAGMQAAGGAALSAEQEFTKLGSALKTMMADLGQSGVLKTIAEQAGALADKLNTLREARERLGKFFTGQTQEEVAKTTGGAPLKPEASPLVAQLATINTQLDAARTKVKDLETTINTPSTQGGIEGWWASLMVRKFRNQVELAQKEIQRLEQQHDSIIAKIQTLKIPPRGGTEADLASPELRDEHLQQRTDQQERLVKRTKEVQAEMARIAKEEVALRETLQRTGVDPEEAAKELKRFLDTEIKAFEKKFSIEITADLKINPVSIPATTLTVPAQITPAQAQRIPRAPADQRALFQQEGQRVGVDPLLLEGLAYQESRFNPRAVSPRGAQGVMQLMPGTARELGVKDPFNIAENIRGGADYFAQMLKQFGTEALALAAYNAGPGRVQRSGREIGRLPSETQAYVPIVQRNAQAYRMQMGTTTPPATVATGATPPDRQSTGALDAVTQLRARQTAQEAVTQGLKDQAEAEEIHARAVVKNNDAIADMVQRLKDNAAALVTGKSGMDAYERGLVLQDIALKAVTISGKDAWHSSLELAKSYDAAATALEKENDRMEEAIELGRKWKETQDAILSGGTELELARQAGAPDLLDTERTPGFQQELDDMQAEAEARRRTIQEIEGHVQGMTTTTNSFMNALTANRQSSQAGARVEDLEAQLAGVKKNSEAWLLLKQQIAEAKQQMAEFSSASGQAWMEFANTAIQELLRIYESSETFRTAMDSIFASIAEGIATLFKPAQSSGAGLGELALNAGISILGAYGGMSGGGDITQGGFGTYNMQHGGILPANHRAMTGEAGQELMLSQGQMRLVGTRGPEVIRPKSMALVIPHRETMTMLRQGHSRGSTIPLRLRAGIDQQLAQLKMTAPQDQLASPALFQHHRSNAPGKANTIPWEAIAQKDAPGMPSMQTQRPARESSVASMAGREVGGAALAGAAYVAGESGMEAVIGTQDTGMRRGGRGKNGNINITMHIHGADNPKTFERSSGEIKRNLARAMQDAQRSL